jgi:hypothetical protein
MRALSVIFGEIMIFLQISRHSTESCRPILNKTVKKVYVDHYAKTDQLTKKHGVKMVKTGCEMEHLPVALYETRSMGVLLKFSTEPEIMMWNGHNETELPPAMTVEEAMKPVKRTKHDLPFFWSQSGCLTRLTDVCTQLFMSMHTYVKNLPNSHRSI